MANTTTDPALRVLGACADSNVRKVAIARGEKDAGPRVGMPGPLELREAGLAGACQVLAVGELAGRGEEAPLVP